MNRLAEVTNVTMPKGTVGGTPMMGDGPKGKGKEKKVKKVKVKKVKKEKKGAFSSPSLMRKAEARTCGIERLSPLSQPEKRVRLYGVHNIINISLTHPRFGCGRE